MTRILSMIGVLAIGLLVGIAAGRIWSAATWDAKEAKWKAVRDAELNDSLSASGERLAALVSRLAVAESLATLARNETLAARRMALIYADSALIYRAALRQTTTLAECQAVGERLAAACTESVQRAERAWEQADNRADHLERQVRDLTTELTAAEQQRQRLTDLLRTAPVDEPPRRWLGFLPRPTTVIGIGCAGGLAKTAGCGISVVLGFPIHH